MIPLCGQPSKRNWSGGESGRNGSPSSVMSDAALIEYDIKTGHVRQ